MSLVVRDDLSVPISKEMAEKMGLYPGSLVEWERMTDGGYTLRAVAPHQGAGSRLHGVLKPYLKEEGGGVEAFLDLRREDARLDGSL